VNDFKTCPSCGESKLTSAFGANKALPDGLSFYCLECNRQRNRGYYAERRRRQGVEVREPDPSPPGFQRCADCRESKPLDDFHRASTKSGRAGYCKPCRAVRGAESHLRRNYGLTRTELEALLEVQGGLCAICGRNVAVHVDHDHATGRVRGVLCFTCNVALGQLNDDPQLFRRAIDYLERETWRKTSEG
jgi:hypothetical protein